MKIGFGSVLVYDAVWGLGMLFIYLKNVVKMWFLFIEAVRVKDGGEQ